MASTTRSRGSRASTSTSTKQGQSVGGDAPLKSEECLAENSALIDANVLGDTSLFELGLFFFFEQEVNNGKDFTNHYSCTNETVLGTETLVCDYTSLLEYLRPTCELFGGQLYAVSANQTCPNPFPDFPDPENIMDVNYPLCIGPRCNVQIWIDSLTNIYGDCVDAQHTIVEFDRTEIQGESCQQEMERLLAGDGIGSPEFVFANGDYVEMSCNGTEFGENCDFSESLDEIRVLCEQDGGYLYAFSDRSSNTLMSKENGTVLAQFNDSFLQVPLCLGLSCDGERYIEDLIGPYYEYILGGTYDEVESAFPPLINVTRTTTYEFIGFTIVSEVPMDDSLLGTTVPTDAVFPVETMGADNPTGDNSLETAAPTDTTVPLEAFTTAIPTGDSLGTVAPTETDGPKETTTTPTSIVSLPPVENTTSDPISDSTLAPEILTNSSSNVVPIDTSSDVSITTEADADTSSNQMNGSNANQLPGAGFSCFFSAAGVLSSAIIIWW